MIAAAALPGFYVAHRRVSLWKPSAQSYRVVPAVLVGATVVALVAHGTGGGAPAYTAAARSAFEAGSNRGAGSPTRDLAVLAGTDFVPASFVPYQSPFFSRRRRRGSGACSTTRP